MKIKPRLKREEIRKAKKDWYCFRCRRKIYTGELCGRKNPQSAYCEDCFDTRELGEVGGLE